LISTLIDPSEMGDLVDTLRAAQGHADHNIREQAMAKLEEAVTTQYTGILGALCKCNSFHYIHL
jgi:hypothetical protein